MNADETDVTLSTKVNTPKESKALALARYLKEFVGLRSSTVLDVDKYETVLWFDDMPQVAECQSPTWIDGCEPGTAWLTANSHYRP